ncbi:protein asteroid isoform X2 [Dendroctonus ponderosae]|nr:protein asteroid isoform X2 [Dendroctonus ponderosae]XP_019754478.1 protein asteroid isoform X2 [Dendroctonus ponderosae]
MKNKICAAESLNAMTEGSAPVFPLFLREVFVDVVLSLGLKVARCEFEGDMEIAGIAQALNCPVISYDSDFYVLGCLYIPFTTVEVTARKGKTKPTKIPYLYISCKIYHVENFLQAYGGLDKGNLPLLAVILGNDYINGRLFAPFFRNLKMQKCSSNQSDQQKRIKSVIVWLQNENIESAIRTILSRFKNHRRQVILSQIESAMKGYNEVNSELLKFLDIDQSTLSNFCIDFNRLRISEEPESKTDDSESDDESGIEHETLDSVEEPEEKSTVKSLNSDIQDNIITTKIFQEKYRACQYPACFMDMISLSRYYCVPQVENSSAEHSHTISLDLLKIVYQILTPNCSRGLTIVFRNGKHGIKYVILPRIALDTPSLGEIQLLSVEKRQELLLQFISFDNSFNQLLQTFSIEWRLFFISLKYACTKGSFDSAIIYGCLICFLTLNFIDPKVGFCRVTKTFEKKFAQTLANAKQSIKQTFSNFENLVYDECLIFLGKVISCFQMDSKLKMNYRLYDKELVHSLAQMQSIFLHIKYLNALLNNPYPLLEVHKIFDGTFIYNITANLRKRTDIVEYLNVFLNECPSLLEGIKYLISIADSNFNCENTKSQHMKKHRKKKKQPINTEISGDPESSEEESESVFDPNNPFSILSCL